MSKKVTRKKIKSSHWCCRLEAQVRMMTILSTCFFSAAMLHCTQQIQALRRSGKRVIAQKWIYNPSYASPSELFCCPENTLSTRFLNLIVMLRELSKKQQLKDLILHDLWVSRRLVLANLCSAAIWWLSTSFIEWQGGIKILIFSLAACE